MFIRYLQLLICLSSIQLGIGQIVDDFSDGEISNAPLWSGDVANFEVNNDGQLHLVASVAGTSQLVTNTGIFDKVVWEFYVHMDFNPSSSNYLKVYMLSDQSDLSGSLNGYYLIIGDTEDEISLYKQKGLSSTQLINGLDGIVASNPTVRVKVIRDQTGRFSLYHDLSGGNQYVYAGSVLDNDPDIVGTSQFGFVCNYTVTRADKFYFDDVRIAQLQIDSIAVKDELTVEVYFNQHLLESEATEISNYLLEGLQILSASLAEADSTHVTLSLDTATPLTTGEFLLQIDNALTLNEKDVHSFDYIQLKLDTVQTLSANELLLDFNDYLDPNAAQDITNYIVDQGIGQPLSSDINPNDPSQIIIVFDQVFSDAVNYQVDVSGIFNHSVNSDFTGGSYFSYIIPLLIESVEVLSADSLLVKFNKKLKESSALLTSNYFINQGIGMPISLNIQEDSQSVCLVFDEGFSSDIYQLSISEVEDTEGYKIEPESTISFSYLPLSVSNFFQLDDERMAIQFNQKVQSKSAEMVRNYSVLEMGNPVKAIVSPENDSIIELTLPDLVNADFELMIEGVENYFSNSIIDRDTVLFKFEKPTPFRAVQINEIMADFSPSLGLPEAEYVELFNPGDLPINIENFLLNGERISTYELKSNQYLLIMDDSDNGLFEEVSVQYLASFDALTNGGDTVILRDQFGNLVDSIFYTTEWYGDVEKDDGGYSLEQINQRLICSSNLNWKASTSFVGGTPGLPNSVLATEEDLVGPYIEKLQVVTGDTLLITLNEAIADRILTTDNVQIPGGVIQSIERISYLDYSIILDRKLTSEKAYSFELNNLVDCQGNITVSDSLDFYFDTTAPYLEKLNILSDHEIALLFHEPLVASSAEAENNYLLLQGLKKPLKAILQDSATNRVHLTFDTTFHIGSSYDLRFMNLEDTSVNTMGSTVQPFDFMDQVDTVKVILSNLIIVDFSDEIDPQFDQSNFLVTKGIGNPSRIERNENDLTALKLAFDDGLIPNVEYSLYIQNLISAEDQGQLVTPAKTIIYDTRAPKVEDLIIKNDSQMVVVWDEPILLSSAFSSIQYTLQGFDHPVDIQALSSTEIKLTFDFLIPMEELLTLKVSGIQDLFGNTLGNTTQKFVYDPRPPEIITSRLLDENSICILLSEKLDTSSVFNPKHYEVNGENPTNISYSAPDSLELVLAFTSIPSGRNQPVSIFGVKDKYGNQMDTIHLSLNTLDPQVVNVGFISDTIAVITFSKAMDASIAEIQNYQTINNHINFIELNDAKKVKIMLSREMSEQDSLGIHIINLMDTVGNLLDSQSVWSVFDTFFHRWRLIDIHTLQLKFETGFSELKTDQFLLNNEPPAWVHMDGEDKGLINLIFSDSLLFDQLLSLKWNQLFDLYGRRLPDNQIEFIIDKTPPSLVSVNNDYNNKIQLLFDEPITREATSLNHYRMMENVELYEVIKESDNIVSLVFDHLMDGQNYNLVFEGLSDLYGNFSRSDTTIFQYQTPHLPGRGDLIINELLIDPFPAVELPESEYVELFNVSNDTIPLSALIFSDASRQMHLPDYEVLPGAYVILSSQQLDYENAIKVPQLPTLDNLSDSLTLSNIRGEIIDCLVYQKDWYGDTDRDEGGYSLELVNPYSDCPGIVNWGVSTDKSGGTPGVVNAIYSERPDIETPVLLNYTLEENSLLLNFSEPMDSVSLALASYQAMNLDIDKVMVSGTYHEKVMLDFSTDIKAGILYDLHVEGPVDCSGNTMDPFTLPFGFGKRPEFNEMIITEIMADPDPVMGLPNSEYLEIYNRTDQLISLKGVKLKDETGEMLLPAATLKAHQFALFVPTGSAQEYQEHDHVIGVSGWNSLSNQGERIALFYQEDLIFNLEYSHDWYSEEVDGGVSLEMKDINNPCGGRNNWASSISSSGGTPGKVNSVVESIPDNFGPELQKVEVLSDLRIRLHFNEPLTFRSVENDQIEVLPGPIIVQEVIQDTLTRNYLDIMLKEQLVSGTDYKVTINKIYDCNNNPIQRNGITFLLPEQPDSLDVIITEILFNPRSNGVDFVEIYNRSDKNLNLKDWHIGRVISGAVNRESISSEDFIFTPGQYLALTADASLLFDHYPKAVTERVLQLPGFPVFPNESGSVIIEDSDDQIMDTFDYHEDMHLSFLKSVEGVSLERISMARPTQDENNWQSAAQTVGFATPGYENSQSLEPTLTGTLSIEPKVFVPANLVSPLVKDFTTINYQLGQNGKLANVTIYNRNGLLVKQLAAGVSLSTNGFFRWDGTTDRGTTATIGNYLIVFELYDLQGQREILKETVVVGQ